MQSENAKYKMQIFAPYTQENKKIIVNQVNSCLLSIRNITKLSEPLMNADEIMGTKCVVSQ